MIAQRVSLLRRAKTPIDWYAWVSRDGHNQDTFKPVEVVMTYEEDKVVLVANREGKEVQSQKQLYITGSYNLLPDDKFVIEGRTHVITALTSFRMYGARSYWVVYL